MSRELQCRFPGDAASLYALITRVSDDYIWSTVASAFVAFVDADIANYDVALTARLGDRYTADMPSAVTAATLIVDYYERAGATPAITDLRLTGEKFYWNGTVASSASEVTLSAYALTSLESAKRWQGITASTWDTRLTEIINGVSAEIERITGIKFKARNYRVWVDGRNQRRLVLRQHPIQYVTRVVYGSANAMTLTYSGSAIRASASVYRDPESADAGGLRLVTVSTTGVPTENNLSFATYRSLSELETAIEAVSGWTAEVLTNMPSLDLHVTGGEDAKSRTVTLTYPDQDEDAYRLDARMGMVSFDRYAGGGWGWVDGHDSRMPCGHQEVCVEYRGGYETIPADVQMLANDLVKEAYAQSTQNTALSSSSLGPFSVSFNSESVAKVRSRLALYMDATALIGGVA